MLERSENNFFFKQYIYLSKIKFLLYIILSLMVLQDIHYTLMFLFLVNANKNRIITHIFLSCESHYCIKNRTVYYYSNLIIYFYEFVLFIGKLIGCHIYYSYPFAFFIKQLRNVIHNVTYFLYKLFNIFL
jgi:hypothetical protein